MLFAIINILFTDYALQILAQCCSEFFSQTEKLGANHFKSIFSVMVGIRNQKNQRLQHAHDFRSLDAVCDFIEFLGL